MSNVKSNGRTLSADQISVRRRKFGTILCSDPNVYSDQDDKDSYRRSSSASVPSPRFYNNIGNGGDASPYYYNNFMSPFNQPSPFTKSPWCSQQDHSSKIEKFGLIGSIIRQEGHIYSLAASGDLLYTGSESKNIRVWKSLQEFSGFKSSSGLVKAIVVFGDKIFTGHQDGKIRVWRFSGKENNKAYKRVGSLPTTKDYLKKSINPKNYVEVRRHRVRPWIKHFDAVSCMSVDVDQGLLYSVSWDKTLKVWRISDSKCLESINAHADAVNTVVVGFDGLIFTGSADGTVKVWRREFVGNKHSNYKHIFVVTLLKQENAVTSLAVNAAAGVLYAGSSDGLVKFWEREKHVITHAGVLRGHKLAVLCLAAAGNLVLSGSADKTICVWKRAEGGIHTCLSVLTGHTGPVKCLAIEEDREEEEDSDKCHQRWIVYSGSLDKSVKVWRVPEHANHLNLT